MGISSGLTGPNGELSGGDQPGLQEYEESSLERKQNKANAKFLKANGGKVEYPKCLHKPHGLTRIVKDDAEEAAALAKGWYADIRDIETEEVDVETTLVSRMSIAQAVAFIAAAPIEDLAAIEADEASHGNRAKVIEAIEAAKDAIPTPKKAKAKK